MHRGLLTVSERMAAITGLPAGKMPAQGAAALEPYIEPTNLAAIRADFQRSRETGGVFGFEFQHTRPDNGQQVWVRVAGVMVRAEDGQPLGLSGIVEDISPRKLEEEQRQILMTDIDHRVKNVLAAVHALAIQTARRTTSLDGFLQSFGGRAEGHRLGERAAHRRPLAGRPLSNTWSGPRLARWRLDRPLGKVPDIFLTPRAANAMAMGLYELLSNAAKFGALSVENGRITVRWQWRADSGGFDMIWTESGGPAVVGPSRRGFGSTLLEQVTSRELNGDTLIEYRASGVRVLLRAGEGAVAERPETLPEGPTARPPEVLTTSSAPADLKGARVLIVEDAVLLALELETGLQEAGARVIGPAYELQEAMALLDHQIDAAVLDANLNGRSVIPVAEALAARGVPFVFATGYGESAGAPGGFDAPVIRKPYDVTQVAAAVAELLRAK
jgi:PAS domain S-box-containing protein